MQVLVKVIEHQFIDTVITQELIDSKVEIDEDLNGFGIAKFSIPMTTIQEDNKIELYEIWNTDKKIFTWYVYKVEPVRKQFWILNIECRSEKALFNKRLCLNDINISSDDIAVAIQTILNEYIPYWETRLIETDFTQNVSIDIKKWDNWYDVLDELASQNNAVRDIQNAKILFKSILWNDYTSWPLYKEITYNWLYPNNSNIKSISVIWTATRNNIVVAEDANHNVMFDSSWYVDRIYWVGKNEFRSWNLNANLQKMIVSWNKVQRTYEVEVEQNTLDVNIWDKIKLIVENTNSYFDINSEVYITKKNTIYNNGSKLVKYNVWEIDVFPQNIENWLYWIQKKTKLLTLG